MKAIFLSFNQAHYDDITELLPHQGQKGFTSWEDVSGCGSRGGLPHLGTHAYPTLNSAIFISCEDHHLKPLMDALHELDSQSENLGLRAFYWTIEGTI